MRNRRPRLTTALFSLGKICRRGLRQTIFCRRLPSSCKTKCRFARAIFRALRRSFRAWARFRQPWRSGGLPTKRGFSPPPRGLPRGFRSRSRRLERNCERRFSRRTLRACRFGGMSLLAALRRQGRGARRNRRLRALSGRFRKPPLLKTRRIRSRTRIRPS